MEPLSPLGDMVGLSESLSAPLRSGMGSKQFAVEFLLFGRNLVNQIHLCLSMVWKISFIFRLRFSPYSVGFLRTSPWSIHEIITTENEASVTFIIHSTPETLLLWPHPFRVFYTVTISEEGLFCRLKTINIGETPFKCHALLHTYFSIPNIAEVSFSGYGGLQYVDKTRDNQTFQQTDEEEEEDGSSVFQITGEVDRVYFPSSSSSGDVTIHHLPSSSPLMTIQKSAQIETQFSSFVTVPCDCVLWNPWVDKSRALADMDDSGYLSFVCVEPGVVSEYVTVAPGEALNLSQMLIPTSAAVIAGSATGA
jgi:D-hexose-6-phosphate mutarotase